MFYTRSKYLPRFVTSVQVAIFLILTVAAVDIFSRYVDSTPKPVTEQSKMKIPVVTEHNETSTI